MIDHQYALLANTVARTYYEWWRVHQLDQWWHWMVLTLVAVLFSCLAIWMYRKDAFELRSPTSWSLLILRLFVLICLLGYFLQLERRTERRMVKNSRAVLLIDTSQSMGLPATDNPDEIDATRLAGVQKEFADGTLLDKLRQNHDVLVYRFDQGSRPVEIASLPKSSGDQLETGQANGPPALAANEATDRWSALLLLIAILAMAAHIGLALRSSRPHVGSWALFVSVVAAIAGSVSWAYQDLVSMVRPEYEATATSTPPDEAKADGERTEETSDPHLMAAKTESWISELKPRGAETRMADALNFLIDQEQGGPIAGISIFTDGNQNAGPDCLEAAAAAADAGIALFPIGFGSKENFKNVRIADVAAPARVYPGDSFSITAYLQSYGLEGQSADLELWRREKTSSGSEQPADETLIDLQTIRHKSDGEVDSVEFELTPDEVGQVQYVLRIKTAAKENPRDNTLLTNVQVVDRQNRVLLLAGGPTREYRFVRNLCFRDKMISTDVVLQTRLSGTSQEADNVLEDFPTTVEEMFDYDCVIAFDPDWESFSAKQVELLERWIGEQAGGMVVVAGPVHTPEWSSRRDSPKSIATVKALYPVSFYSHSAARVGRRRYSSNVARPLEFSESGTAAKFLWIGETGALSTQAWNVFEGCYGFQIVRGEKPGATVYATLGESDNSLGDPPFLVGHFYGAGRVLYLGSGEMWRLRSTGASHFDRLYTNLIRYVSEGRLLRDSSRGLLIVDKEQCLLGETVSVRAFLTDRQHRPLMDEAIRAEVTLPSGLRQPLDLKQSVGDSRQGTFVGQFTAVTEGYYQIELLVPDSDHSDLLVEQVRARVPDLEIQTPQRNDALLTELAERTDGNYFVGIDAVTGQRDTSSLVDAMVPQDQATFLPGTPDRGFQQRLMKWYLMLMCGALTLEWLIRRFHRLA